MINTKTEQHKKEYRMYRNKLTHVKEQAKKLYFNKEIKLSQHNSGMLWKTVNNIIKHKQSKSLQNVNLKDDNEN